MSQTIRADRVSRKNGMICLVSMLLSRVMVIKLFKKVHFCNFMLTSPRNLNILKQFTYMRLRGIITHFQKMVLFMLWFTVSEILGFEVKELC